MVTYHLTGKVLSYPPPSRFVFIDVLSYKSPPVFCWIKGLTLSLAEPPRWGKQC